MDQQLSMDQKFLASLTGILEVNLDREHFGVKELAKEIGLSKSQLLRKLTSLKGKSTSQFIREYRLQKANELLTQQAGTASEIAYRVGFSSPTYFSTCFHEYYGFPPGEAKLRNGNDHMDSSAQESPSMQVNERSKKRILVFSILGLLLVAAVSSMIYFGFQNKEQSLPVPLETEEKTKSIGVLPFSNLSGNPEFDYVSEGMTGAIIDKLTRIESFKKVVPFTTMATFEETDKSIQEIALELGVTHLLEGNLQKAGDTVKIVLRLIDGRTDSYDWSEEFIAAWEIDELFQMQADVTENVALKLGVELRGRDDVYATINRKPTNQTEAFTYYQQAEFQKNKYDKAGFDLAEILYNKAIQIDSSFAEPYAGLGCVWQLRAWWGFHKEEEAIANSLRNLEKAVELDPNNRWAVDFYYIMNFWYYWDFDKIESLFQKLQAEGTLYKVPHLMDYARKTKRLSAALQIQENYIIDLPNDPKHNAEKIVNLWLNGKYVECEKMLNEEAHLFDHIVYYNVLAAKFYIGIRKYEDAFRHVKKIQITDDSSTYDKISYNWLSAVIQSKSGFQKVVEGHLSELIKIYEDKDSGSPGWFTALYFSAIGNQDKAIEWLQKSYEQHEVEMTWLYAEPLLEPIRNDPRYKELLHKVGFSKVIPL